MTSEDIKKRQWTDAERRAVRCPRLTNEQLANMVLLRDAKKPKVAVSERLDPPVLEWLKSRAKDI